MTITFFTEDVEIKNLSLHKIGEVDFLREVGGL